MDKEAIFKKLKFGIAGESLIINAPEGLVTIRNFSVNGSGTTLGINGIRVIAVKKLHIENCTLSNFSDKGIDINSTTKTDVVLNNVTIHNANDAISIMNPSGSVVINGCQLQNINNAGINLTGGEVTVNNSVISGCNTGMAVQNGATIHLSGNTITNNNTAFQGPGKINSAGNNLVVGNKTLGSAPSVVKTQ